MTDRDTEKEVYFGNEQDGVYIRIDVTDDDRFIVTTYADCDSAHFVEDLHEEAVSLDGLLAAVNTAIGTAADWLFYNEVECDNRDEIEAELIAYARA